MDINQVSNALPTSDIIQLISICVALLIGIISIIISIITIKQNNKMLEESTRPVISIYGESINTSLPQLYIVIKNFGQTPTTITKFDYDFDFISEKAYAGDNVKNRDFLKELVGSTLAPNQSRICFLEYDNINSPINFEIEHKSPTKTYHDTMLVNLKAASSLLIAKSTGNGSDGVLGVISYTLQEMLQKSL